MSIALSPIKSFTIKAHPMPHQMPLMMRIRGAFACLSGKYHGLDVSVVAERVDGSKEEKYRKVLFPYEAIQIDLLEAKELGDGDGGVQA
jgi:hypothetical protein